jgi:hypothetical protein
MGKARLGILAVFFGLLITAGGTQAVAQFRIGAHGGLCIPNIRGSETDKFSKGFISREGPFFGIFTDVGLSRHFSLVAELNYTSQGGKKNGMQLVTNLPPGLPTDMDLYADFKNETIMDYVELHILGRLIFGNRIRFFVDAGPYTGYLVRARAVTKDSSLIYLDETGTMPIVPSPVSFDANTDVMDSLKKWNAGLAGGGGVFFPAGPGHMILEAHFELGLSTIQRDVATSGNSKTGAVVISLGYEFSLVKSR